MTNDSSVQINFCMNNYDIPKPPRYIYDLPSKLNDVSDGSYKIE